MKAIVFDINDTLINTFETAYLRNAYCFTKLKVDTPKREEFKKVFGKVSFPECLLDWIELNKVNDFMEIYPESRFVHPYEPMCNIYQLVHYCKKYVDQVGILTNTSDEQLKQKFREINVDLNIFDFIACNAQKPNCKFFKGFSEQTNYKPEQIIYVSDSFEDVSFIRNQNICFLGVLTGNSLREDFINQGLTDNQIFDSVAQIMTKGLKINEGAIPWHPWNEAKIPNSY